MFVRSITGGRDILATFKTQRDAIDWAKNNGHTPHIARVRHLNDKKKADHWRAVQAVKSSNRAKVFSERLALPDLSKEQRFRKVGDITVGLLKVQRSFIDKDKFVIADKAGNVNGNALGYVFGMLDALLQYAAWTSAT